MRQKALFYLYPFFLNLRFLWIILLAFSLSYGFIQPAYAEGEISCEVVQISESVTVDQDFIDKMFSKERIRGKIKSCSMRAIKEGESTESGFRAGTICQILAQAEKLEFLIKVAQSNISYMNSVDKACMSACAKEQATCEASCSDEEEKEGCSGGCASRGDNCEAGCSELKEITTEITTQKDIMIKKGKELEEVIEKLQSEGSGSSLEDCKQSSSPCPIKPWDPEQCPIESLSNEKRTEYCDGEEWATCKVKLEKCCSESNEAEVEDDNNGGNGGNGGNTGNGGDEDNNLEEGETPSTDNRDSSGLSPDNPQFSSNNGGDSEDLSIGAFAGSFSDAEDSNLGFTYNDRKANPKQKIDSIMRVFNQEPSGFSSGRGFKNSKSTGFNPASDDSGVPEANADLDEEPSEFEGGGEGAYSATSTQASASAEDSDSSETTGDNKRSPTAKGNKYAGFGNGKVAQTRSQFLASKSVSLGKDHVGVKEDNIFIMVHRMNRKLDEEESYFIEDF